MLGLAEIIAPLPRIATQLTQRRNANRTVTRQLKVISLFADNVHR
jgi:hypothetical protein